MEAARIDGATEPKVWRYVVLPSLRTATTFITVLLVIGGAQVFTQVFEVTAGAPYNSTQTFMTYLHQLAFVDFQFGYAAALGSLLALVLFAFSWVEISVRRQQET